MDHSRGFQAPHRECGAAIRAFGGGDACLQRHLGEIALIRAGKIPGAQAVAVGQWKDLTHLPSGILD